MQNDLATFDVLAAEITQFVQPAMTIKVNDKPECDNALATAKQVKALQKKLKERRDEFVKPLKAQIETIDALYKKYLGPLDDTERHLKQQMIAFEQALEKARAIEADKIHRAQIAEAERLQAEQLKLDQDRKAAEKVNNLFDVSEGEVLQQKADAQLKQAEIDRQAFESEQEAQRALKAAAAQRVSGTQVVWTFVVEDESKVPTEYKVVEDRLIREAIKKGLREIPGVKIFQQTRMAIR